MLHSVIFRIMRVWPVETVRIHAIMGTVITIFFSVAAYRSGQAAPWILPFTVGPFYFLFSTRRYFRRRKMKQKLFPEQWRTHLNANVPFYRRLDPAGRERFETDIRIFLAEQHIYGVRGHNVPDDVKLLIAASAAILGHGLPDWDWPDVRDIVVYPTAFDEDYDVRGDHPMAGMVHQQGPILLSERDLKMGFFKRRDGLHVGLHELAHVLDMATGSADGIPAGLNWVATAPWVKIMADRIQKVQKGKIKRVLRPYAGVNEAEFFAVAVEVFFEKPMQMKSQDPDL